MSNGNYCGDRPASYYDNYGRGGCDEDNTSYKGYYDADDKYDKLRNEMLGYERAKSPTQTISLLTTVPQNITPMNIAGRHAPTRHSLRHSRMIVMNRLGTSAVPINNNNNNNNNNMKSSSPMQLQRFQKLAKVLVALQFTLGIVICSLAFWIYLFAPNIKQKDNPYWAGIPLAFSGLIGLLLFCCPRKDFPTRQRNSITHSTKVLSIFLSVVAGAVCFIASIFAFIHLIGLAFMDCEPVFSLNNSCLCTMSNTTSSIALLPSFVMDKYHYADLQCPELNDFFVFLMIGSCGCNLIGALIALWYVYLHWSSRCLYAYTKMHTNSSPAVINMHD